MTAPLFLTHTLDHEHSILQTSLPCSLCPNQDDDFQAWWDLHPTSHRDIVIHGKRIPTPRWDQSYGRDYSYSGQTNQALPLHPDLEPILSWCQKQIDPDLNGVLVNWYEGASGHYIGPHRDSRTGLRPGSSIITLSLGQERTFRLRPYKTSGRHDFNVEHGSILVIPWETNLAYTHEVPHFVRYTERRISITLRAFV